MAYKITETGRFRDDFRRLMPGVRTQDMVDGLMTVLSRRVAVDIAALDRELERLYPREWESSSMLEIVERHYGRQAVEFLDEVT